MSGAAALEAVPLGRRPEGRFAGGGDSYGLLQIPYMLAKFVFPMMKYEVNRAVGSRLCRSIESPTALRFSLSIAVECRLQASFRILRLHPALYNCILLALNPPGQRAYAFPAKRFCIPNHDSHFHNFATLVI